MRWRIRSQLLLPLLLLLAGVVVVSAATAVTSARRARLQLEKHVADIARNVCEQTNYPLTQNILEQMNLLSGADYLVVNDSGRVTTTLPDGDALGRPAGPVRDDWQTLHLDTRVTVGGRAYLCSGVRLRPPRTGDTLYILYPETKWRDALWEAMWPVVVLGGSVGLASVVLAIGLGQRLSRRVQELERRTRLIAAGDFSPMPLPDRDDEVRDLTRSVNEMAQRLAQFRETAQRTERLRLLGQVSGGLAHQLRNGLTGARLAVQLYLREDAGHTDTSALEVALRQLTLLETHLKRFLDLGRTGCSRRALCSLPDLVNETVELLRPQCRHAGIDLRWQTPDEAYMVLGDAGQLGQLILNVLGNAVEAAGTGGWIAAALGCEPGGVWLEVSDSGPGPAPEVAERLFEPFVTGKPEGVGLGLAVARQVAEAHGGRIHWSRADGRTCFRIELPRAAELAPQGPGGVRSKDEG
jgi:signal transduction histidine kinase